MGTWQQSLNSGNYNNNTKQRGHEVGRKKWGRVMVALERDGGEEILSIIYSINIYEYINVFERIVFF